MDKLGLFEYVLVITYSKVGCGHSAQFHVCACVVWYTSSIHVTPLVGSARFTISIVMPTCFKRSSVVAGLVTGVQGTRGWFEDASYPTSGFNFSGSRKF